MFGASKTKQVSSAANYIEDCFSPYLYTGNNGTQNIVNGIDLSTKGGMVWSKSRSAVGDNHVYDTARGIPKVLFTNGTNPSTTYTNGYDLTSFNTNGFSLGPDDYGANTNGVTYGSWTFRKQPKFFDVVTFTADGSGNASVSHNLGSVPGCIIVKRTDSTGYWYVFHRSLNNGTNADNYYLYLNSTNAQYNTGSQIYIATSTNVSIVDFLLAPGGQYVMYLFAHNAGGFGLTGTDNVISCGSFTADGSGSIGNVTLGYEPQWILWKNTTNAGGWYITDTMRGWTTQAGSGYSYLSPQSSAAEGSNSNSYYAVNSTGFGGTGGFTASNTYIYIAIRRGPMKVPTDATKVFAPVLETTTTNPQTVTTNFPVDLTINGLRTSGFAHYVVDRLRGSSTSSTKYLVTTATDAESTTTGLGFDNNTGIVDAGFWDNVNAFYWNFRRAPSFFDEVCYTGTGSATTFNHNLGVAPELMIFKRRSSAASWGVYCNRYNGGVNANQYYQVLNQPDAESSGSGLLNNTNPTSSVFTVGTWNENNASGSDYVAYLFATCAGVSKVGSYTGNGTTQTINCGFAGGARFVLIKRTDSTGDWYVYDTARGMTTLVDPYLLLNSTAAESATLGSVTTVTTGFAVNASILAAINTNGASYIFLAIA